MTNQTNFESSSNDLTLVLGGTGKTGRRVVERLHNMGRKTRVASRSATPSFNWNHPENWSEFLGGVTSVYITYAPDLAIPGATQSIKEFVDLAVLHGIGRLVLLSGRGEEEAQACEKIVQEASVKWTIVRASWFMQNFSEGEFLNMVLDGAITLPANDVAEPFIDINDIADVAVAALTEEGHDYEIYEVTGPRLMTFAEAGQEISAAANREIPYIQLPKDDFNQAVIDSGAPDDIVWLLNYLFETVLDGRNAYLAHGVQRALGREPVDFTDFARRIADRGVWNNNKTEVGQ